jgi:hemolysin activation/secretion protein
MSWRTVGLALIVLAILLRPGDAARADPIRVERIDVRGNSVLPQSELDRVTSGYLHRDLDAEGLESLRRDVTLLYVNQGYIASGAVIKSPVAPDGTLAIDVVEGYVAGIDVKVIRVNDQGGETGTIDRPGLRSYVCDRLALAPGSLLGGPGSQRHADIQVCDRTARVGQAPLNMNVLQQRVGELLQDPNIARLNVEVRPGTEPGEAWIDAKVVAGPSWGVSMSIANDQPPDVGAIRGQIGATVRNLLGFGDALSVAYGRTAGANIANARYEIPFTDFDTRAALYWNYNGAGVVSAAFAGLGITSRNQTAGVSVIQPLSRSDRTLLTVSLSFDYTVSDQYLLGQPFSFQGGYVDGHAESPALRAAADWTWHVNWLTVTTHTVVSHGLDVSPSPATAPFANFTTVLGEALSVFELTNGLELIARGVGQVSSQALYSFEQIAIGGPGTVRGYVQNALVRDSAAIGSLELRAAVGNVRVPRLAQNEKDGEVDIGVFWDGGRGWNHGGPSTSGDGISSVGIGLRWQIEAKAVAQVWYGYALVQPRNSPNLAQPVSFAVGLQF